MSSSLDHKFSLLNVEKPYGLQDVTAVICTKNAEHIIGDCIGAAIEAGIPKVLIVDGDSKDQTRSIARNLGVDVYLDAGSGLGAARNLGAQRCTSRLILFLGPDNLISSETISAMVTAINYPQVVAVSCLTSQEKNDYWSRAADLYRKSVVKPGDARVLPTPTLYILSLLAREPYSESRKFSDDSELFERWNRVFGGRNVVVTQEVIEIGNDSLTNHLQRYSYYGVSDYENFVAGRRSGWSRARQFQSIIHPLRRQLLGTLREASILEVIYFLPGSLIFTFVRYSGWLKVATRDKLRAPRR